MKVKPFPGNPQITGACQTLQVGEIFGSFSPLLLDQMTSYSTQFYSLNRELSKECLLNSVGSILTFLCPVENCVLPLVVKKIKDCEVLRNDRPLKQLAKSHARRKRT